MDLHIDDFCQDVARILLDLFAVFPLKHAIYVEDISGPDTPDEVGLHSRRFEACLGTMLWLAEEGWLRYDSLIYREGIDQAVLTNKAFLLLSAQSQLLYAEVPEQPDAVRQHKQTRVAQLRHALQQRDSQQISHLVHYLLSCSVEPLLPASAEAEPAAQP